MMLRVSRQPFIRGWVEDVDRQAQEDARHPVCIIGSRVLAGVFVGTEAADWWTVWAIGEGVRQGLRYVRSVDDVVLRAPVALAVGSGDCDQAAAVVAALAYAAGCRVRWCVAQGPGGGHAWVEVMMPGRTGWVPCDTTHPEGIGQDPRPMLPEGSRLWVVERDA